MALISSISKKKFPHLQIHKYNQITTIKINKLIRQAYKAKIIPSFAASYKRAGKAL
jgi:hypothetical protein